MVLFIDRIQLIQGCKATTMKQFTSSPVIPGIHLIDLELIKG